ncbi:MAG TPA: hypothetical protein VGA32_01865, partial [Anaerolineales bacterium]
VQNPNPGPATVQVTYMLQGGGTLDRTHIVPGLSRYTIPAHDPAEVGPDQAFSTRLAADLPILVERAMYFAEGGTASAAISGGG